MDLPLSFTKRRLEKEPRQSHDSKHETNKWTGSGRSLGTVINDDHAVPNNDNTSRSCHRSVKKQRQSRPTSLSLTAGVGEWLHKGVRSLGMSPWNNSSTASKRVSMSQTSAVSRPADTTGSTRHDLGEVQQVPQALQEGTWMTKVSGKKRKKMFLKLDPDMGHIVWHSKQPRIIPIENIKEIRSGPSTRLHRHHFQLAQDYEDLWITIIYMLDEHYKILHLIAPSEDISRMWDTTLRHLHTHRMELMTGLGNIEERQRVWERQSWKGADIDRNQQLTFDEVEKMCRKLNINSPRGHLLTWFKQADVQNRRYLEFEDFQRFVKLLKTRKDIVELFNQLKGQSEYFDFQVFAQFMRYEQKSTLPIPALYSLFEKHSLPVSSSTISTSPPSTPYPSKGKEQHFEFPSAAVYSTPLQRRTMTLETLTSFLLSPDNAPFASPSHSSLPPNSNDTSPARTPPNTSSLTSAKHDMTHPLSSYFISSSHNTYLVGHQLVGASTVEGYIRALLAGCRSVEIDVYDGSGSGDSTPSSTEDPSLSGTPAVTSIPSPESEPMVFHGHTFTSKIPLRQICQAIMKYGFIASPYPIIISVENHCSIQGQELMVKIMIEEFGDALVRYPNDGPDAVETWIAEVRCIEGNWIGKGKITELPSPEDLKGRILFKTKNLLLGKSDSIRASRGYGSVYSSESDFEPSSSASESDSGLSGVAAMLSRGLSRLDSERIGKKGPKSNSGEGGTKATGVLQRVRSASRSAAPFLSLSNQSTSSVSSGRSSTRMNPDVPVTIHAGTPVSTPNTSTTHLISQPLVSSPPPISSPLQQLPIATLPLPIPIQCEQSSTTASKPPPMDSYPPVPFGSSVTSTSSMASSAHDNATGSLPTGQYGAHSSCSGSVSILSSSLGNSGGAFGLVRRKSKQGSQKPKMSMALVALLVYTVGVKCHGLKKSGHTYLPSDESGFVSDTKSSKPAKPSKDKDVDEVFYAPEHMFSLSENSAKKYLRTCMLELINHTGGHLVRVYPRGTRMRSTNFEPHRYWSAGCQLVAINWQTFDLGYVINHAMFQRNARCGYVLKPPPLRHPSKPEYSPEKWKKKRHHLNITIISAQQLPRVKVKDGSGHEVMSTEKDLKEREKDDEVKSVDPYVEVSLHVPEWTFCVSASLPSDSSTTTTAAAALSPPESPLRFTTSPSKTHTTRTPTIRNNGFNPIWDHALRIPFDAPAQLGMLDLIFLRFLVKQETTSGGIGGIGGSLVDGGNTETLAVCCVSLGEVREGYRHLPLYDATLSQYLFSTLFVKINVGVEKMSR